MITEKSYRLGLGGGGENQVSKYHSPYSPSSHWHCLTFKNIVIKSSWSFGSYLPNLRRITYDRKSFEMDANEKVRLFIFSLLNTILTFSQSKGWILWIQVSYKKSTTPSQPFDNIDIQFKSAPHPSENVINVRIQMYGKLFLVLFLFLKKNAQLIVLQNRWSVVIAALANLDKVCETVEDRYLNSLIHDSFERWEEKSWRNKIKLFTIDFRPFGCVFNAATAKEDHSAKRNQPLFILVIRWRYNALACYWHQIIVGA